MKLLKITDEMRERSEYDRVILGTETWTREVERVTLSVELRYGDEIVLEVSDPDLVFNDEMGDSFERWPEHRLSLQSKLTRMGFKRI